jgi:hypothetical protein
MENIINTIIRRTIKKVIVAQRVGIYTTLDEVINMIFKELEEQRIIINEQEKDYIKNKVMEGLKYKLKKAN